MCFRKEKKYGKVKLILWCWSECISNGNNAKMTIEHSQQP